MLSQLDQAFYLCAQAFYLSAQAFYLSAQAFYLSAQSFYLSAQAFYLSEIILSFKCCPCVSKMSTLTYNRVNSVVKTQNSNLVRYHYIFKKSLKIPKG